MLSIFGVDGTLFFCVPIMALYPPSLVCAFHRQMPTGLSHPGYPYFFFHYRKVFLTLIALSSLSSLLILPPPQPAKRPPLAPSFLSGCSPFSRCSHSHQPWISHLFWLIYHLLLSSFHSLYITVFILSLHNEDHHFLSAIRLSLDCFGLG